MLRRLQETLEIFETNLQYIDKRLAYHVISKDDSLL